MPLTGEAKAVYQKNYMRKRRAELKKQAKAKGKSPPKRTPKSTRKTRAQKASANGQAKPTNGKAQITIPQLAGKNNPFQDPDRLMASMESRNITEGELAGQLFKLLDWQCKICHFLCGPADIIGVSLARGNGKTTFFANLAVEFLIGELAMRNGEVLIASASLPQAGILFRHVQNFIGQDTLKEERIGGEHGRKRWRMADNTHRQMIQDRKLGSRLLCLGSDPKGAHGYAPSIVLADEPAQWQSGGRRLKNGLETGLGKQAIAKFVALGTRPEEEGHWFNELMEGKVLNSAVHLCAAEDGDPLFEEETYRKANPSYGKISSLKKIINNHAARAQNGGEELSSFKALRLNMGTPEVTDTEAIVSRENWELAITNDPPPREGPCVMGVDLGGGDAMSAAALYWYMTGRLEVYAALPSKPTLKEKGLADAVGERYIKMEKEGFLKVYPGHATRDDLFLEDVFEKVDANSIEAFGSDTYQIRETKQALVRAGIDPEWEGIEWRRVGAGPDGAADIRGFQGEVMDANLKMLPSFLMISAIQESRIDRTKTRHPSLVRRRRNGRNDALQAAVIATGIGRRLRIPTDGNDGSSVDDFVGQLRK